MLTPFFDDFPLMTIIESRDRNNNNGSLTRRNLQPVMDLDLVEAEGEFTVHADIPGVKKEDVDIHIENGLVTITAQKKNFHEEKTATKHHIERSYGTVKRSIRLPNNADANNASASFENGVLEVKLPKMGTPGGTKVNIA